MKRSLVLLFLFSVFYVDAQNPVFYSADNGLAGSLINVVYQDSEGLIWAGSEDGLTKFDGNKFTVYKHNEKDSASLVSNYITSIIEFDNHLFVGGTFGVQIYNRDSDNFSTPLKLDYNNKITVFNGRIDQFLLLKNGELIFVGYPMSKIEKSKSGEYIIRHFSMINEIFATNCVAEDLSGNLFYCERNINVYKLKKDGEKSELIPFEKPEPDIYAMCSDDKGIIYAGTVKYGLMKYNKSLNKFVVVDSQYPVTSLTLLKNKKIMVGTDGMGMKLYNPATDSIDDVNFSNPYFDSHTSKIHSVIDDCFGNIWAAVYQNGLIMIPPENNGFKAIGFRTAEKNVIGNSYITAIAVDKDNNFWIGSDGDGIYCLDSKGVTLKHFPVKETPDGLPYAVIKLFVDSQNRLWMGSYGKGVAMVDKQTGKCKYIKGLIDRWGNTAKHVFGIAEDDCGRIWLLSSGSGLFVYNPDGKTERPFSCDSVINKWGSSLFMGQQKQLYVSTYDGVYAVNTADKHFATRRIKSPRIVYTLYQNYDRKLFMGGMNELAVWNPETDEYNVYEKSDGLAGNSIMSICGNKIDNVYIGTTEGLSVFNLRDRKFTNYYKSDGLAGNEFSKNAACESPDQTIWMGNTHGITVFDPKKIIVSQKKIDIRLTDFYLNGKRLNNIHSNVLQFDYYDNSFVMEFSINEFINREHILFEYRVNNSASVILPQGVNFATFYNLKPGKYTVTVSVVENPFVKSDEYTISFTILPSWWWSFSAILLYVLFGILLIVYSVYRLIGRHRMRKSILLHEQTEAAKEEKLVLFTNISHDIRTPLSLIIDPLSKLISGDDNIERLKKYHIMNHNAKRLLNLANQLLDIRKIDNGVMKLQCRITDITQIVQDVCESFADLAKEKNIKLETVYKTEIPNVNIDANAMDQVITNLISNAFKYTPECGQITVTLLSENSELRIFVRDNGFGIAPEYGKEIFNRFGKIPDNQNVNSQGIGIGLHLARALVKLHGGNLDLHNDPDYPQGACFLISLPIVENSLADNLPVENSSISKSVEPQEFVRDIIDFDNEKYVRPKTKYKVLVVDDEDEMRNYISNVLEPYFKIKTCSNGRDALREVFNDVPDLVLSDVVMAGGDGYTLCEKIKHNIKLKKTAVVLLTGKSENEEKIKGLDCGANAYITKPFNTDVLIKTLQNILVNGDILKNSFGRNTEKAVENIDIPDVKSPDEQLMERIIKVINRNLSNSDLTSEMIASEAGVSRMHLHRKLKELTGQTTGVFVRNIRLQAAAKMLEEKHHNITEVSRECGFSSPSAFTTAFKDLYGVTPKDYRNN